MPEQPETPTRQYIFSEAQIRLLFIGSVAAMVFTLFAILLLASSRPKGRLVEPDRSQYQSAAEDAAERLSGGQTSADGSVTIPIERAMELIAERGVADPFTAQSAQAPAAEREAGAEVDGEAVFTANCAACHQATGQGVPGAFPPLADHLPDLYNAEGGRSYLIQVVLYGLQGAISVAGSSYNGVMPPFAQLSDEQLAATLNHELTSWGNDAQVDAFEPILPEEIAAERDAGLSSAQVYGARPDLGE